MALVGASMGGAAALIAGTRVKPPVAAMVSLSVRTGDKRLEVLSGDFDGLHGWELLRGPATGEEFGPVPAKVVAFLTAHTRS